MTRDGTCQGGLATGPRPRARAVSPVPHLRHGSARGGSVDLPAVACHGGRREAHRQALRTPRAWLRGRHSRPARPTWWRC